MTDRIPASHIDHDGPMIDRDWILPKAVRKQHIYLPDDPVEDEDAANKAYVDTNVQAADALDELEDVNLSSLADNDVLAYDSTSTDWLNQSAGEAGLATATHNHDATYAPAAKGVTNGDSHDHDGGDGAQIDHTKLSNIGTNSHADVDTHIADTTNPHSVTAAQAVAIVDGANTVKDTHIDWGSGANQVDADDIGDGSTNAIPTLTQEGNWDDHIAADNPHAKHVDTEGNETIAGIKTFSSVPVLPASDPTADNEAARKKYVDDQLSGGSAQDACRVYLSANQLNLVSATPTLVELDAEDYDHGGNFNTATHKYVCPHDGVYLVNANVSWTTSVIADKRYDGMIYVDGANVEYHFVQSSANGTRLTNNLATSLELTAGQEIQLYATSNSGGDTVDLAGTSSAFTSMSVAMLYAT